jgi:hypothetical protein
MLKLEPYPFKGPPPLHPLSDLWFWSVPYPTEVPGVCAADYIAVYFRPVSERRSDANTPVIPKRLEVEQRYRLILAPEMIHERGEPDELSFADYDACAKLDPVTEDFIHASNPRDLAEAVYWLTVARTKTARDSASFDCVDETQDKLCPAGLSKLKVEDISSAARCGSDVKAPQSAWIGCLDLSVGIWNVRIWLRPNKDDPFARIEIGETVTIADMRED